MLPEVFYQFSIGICCKTGGLAGNFRQMQYIKYIERGQIIATSHDLTPKGSRQREIPSYHGIQVGQILYSGQIECVG